MRVGQNPAKYVNEVARPEKVTAAVINYIPFLSGFYAEALDVLKVCLSSILSESETPFDQLVFDNGSCPEVQDFLLEEQRAGRIQYLILSEKNLGKGGAWNVVFEAAPGEILAYADSDVLFFPGWLSKSIQLLQGFPNVGMVTSRPFRTNLELCSSTLDWAKSSREVTIEQGQLLPWKTFLEFNLSLGHSEEEIRQIYDSTYDVRLTYKGLAAQVGASHWQFVAYKDVLRRFVPFDMNRPMGQVRQLDERLNAEGYLRLMPTEPLVMNMSNTLPQNFKQPGSSSGRQKTSSLTRQLLDFPPLKKILLSFYNTVFRWYYAR